MTVLIEDDSSIRKLVEYSLSSNGISIVSFPSGEEAFESDLKDAELFTLASASFCLRSFSIALL